MKVHLDCIPCFQRQALDAARFVSNDEDLLEKILREVIRKLQETDWSKRPPEIAHVVHAIVKDNIGVDDPYKEVKKKYNDIALEMYPKLKELVDRSATPLLTSVRLAIAGNIIDFGASSEFNLERTISSVLEKDFKIYHFSEFVKALESSKSITYLADNTGEIVFDRILLETILTQYDIKEILLTVKGAPIINDATREDAHYVGIHELPGLEILETSVQASDIGMKRTSREFLDILEKSDMVISKGQGNYEALSENEFIFFLLLVKCPIIANDLGVRVGDILLKGGK